MQGHAAHSVPWHAGQHLQCTCTGQRCLPGLVQRCRSVLTEETHPVCPGQTKLVPHSDCTSSVPGWRPSLASILLLSAPSWCPLHSAARPLTRSPCAPLGLCATAGPCLTQSDNRTLSAMPPAMRSATAPTSAVRLQASLLSAGLAQTPTALPGWCRPRSAQIHTEHSACAGCSCCQICCMPLPAAADPMIRYQALSWAHIRTTSATGWMKILPSPSSPWGCTSCQRPPAAILTCTGSQGHHRAVSPDVPTRCVWRTPWRGAPCAPSWR